MISYVSGINLHFGERVFLSCGVAEECPYWTEISQKENVSSHVTHSIYDESMYCLPLARSVLYLYVYIVSAVTIVISTAPFIKFKNF